MANIVTHLGQNLNWTAYKAGHNSFTITFTNAGSAFNISTYAFVVNITKIGDTTNVLQLTEASGITNGGAAGTLAIALTQTQANTTLLGSDYWYEIAYTKDEKVYALLQGTLQLSNKKNPESTTTSATVSVSLAGSSVSAAITLAGGGGGTWGSITGTLSGQTDLQTALDAKVDEETFATLTDGSTVTWNTNSRQNPLAKLTSTQSFTIDMTNVKSGACGILKLVKNTASDVTMTFDTSFTNKTQNTSLTTYTFSGSSGNEYFLSFVVEGTAIEWVIGDVAAYTTTEQFALVRRAATQSINNNTLTAVSFDTEVTDNASIYDSGSPTRLTVPGSGNKLAIISAMVSFAADADGIRRIIIYLNGATTTPYGGVVTSPANSSTSAEIQLTAQIPCVGGDYFEIMAQHVAGAALNVTGAVGITIRNL